MAISSAIGSMAISGLCKLFQSRMKQGSHSCDKAPAPPPRDGGGIKKSLREALKSLGLDNASTSSPSDAESASKAFVKELFTALHAQNEGSAGVSAGIKGHGNFVSDLKSLLSKVSGGSESSPPDGAVAALKDKFSKMVSALGGSSDSASLQSLLQKLQSGLSSPSGNLVSTTA